MANDSNRFQAIISHCKEYGFIFPSSEIYDGLQAVYDYGQWGSELKKEYQGLLVAKLPSEDRAELRMISCTCNAASTPIKLSI